MFVLIEWAESRSLIYYMLAKFVKYFYGGILFVEKN